MGNLAGLNSFQDRVMNDFDFSIHNRSAEKRRYNNSEIDTRREDDGSVCLRQCQGDKANIAHKFSQSLRVAILLKLAHPHRRIPPIRNDNPQLN